MHACCCSHKASPPLHAEAGVEEAKELFSESFASGKLFAQRQSFFDALFTILANRDRDWLSLLLQLLFQTLLNFFTGLTASVFMFLMRLPWLIKSYQPSWVSGNTSICSWPCCDEVHGARLGFLCS
jgi:hypothetical protein